MAAVSKPVLVKLTGTDKDDVIFATAGLDAVDGGGGLDKLITELAGAAKGVKVDLKKGVMIDAFGNKDAIKGVEIVVGSAFDDTMSGSDAAESLIGGAGNDRLSGLGGHDELYGMSGDDRLDGGDGLDYLVGGAGNDTIVGGKGFDTADYSDDGGKSGIKITLAKGVVVDGFGDTDKVSGVEKFIGTVFADVMSGGSAADVFFAGAGEDLLFGNNGADVLDGGAGNDRLDGGIGNDSLAAGGGDDRLDGGKGIDAADYRADDGGEGISAHLGKGQIVDGWGNVDTLANIEIVKGSVHADWIAGSERTDYLDGWAGDDQLFGEGGADELYGALGDDLLNGGEGSDYLDGGLGDDALFGGKMWDFFVARINEGADVVMDFDEADLIDLRNTSFKSFDDVAKLLFYEETKLGGGMKLNLGDGSMFILGIQEIKVEDFVFAI